MAPLLAFLAPGSLNHTANIIKGFAIAIGIAIAIGFVWLWWASRQRERRQELTSRARAAFAVQQRLALQYPELADPMLGGLNSAVEIARYKQYVATLLASAEEILGLDPSAEWQATLARQLAPHQAYLTSEDFRQAGWPDCSPAVQSLLQRLASPVQPR